MIDFSDALIEEYDVDEQLVYYNANSRNKRVGDCVKRALSAVLNKPYSEIEKEMAKYYGAGNYSVGGNGADYLSKLGIDATKKHDFDGHTVGEFAENHPKGNYYVKCTEHQDEQDRVGHIVAVIDGDIYDSWDSQKYYVKYYIEVPENEQITHKVDTHYDIEKCSKIEVDTMNSLISEVQKKLGTNYKIKAEWNMEKCSGYTDVITIKSPFDYIYTPNPNTRTQRRLAFEIDVSFIYSPFMTQDDAEKYIYNRINTAGKKAVIRIVKEQIENDFRTKQIEGGKEYPDMTPKEKELWAKLPQWCRENIVDIEYYSSIKLYTVSCKPLKNDPDQKHLASFDGYSIKEVLDNVKEYEDKVNSSGNDDSGELSLFDVN